MASRSVQPFLHSSLLCLTQTLRHLQHSSHLCTACRRCGLKLGLQGNKIASQTVYQYKKINISISFILCVIFNLFIFIGIIIHIIKTNLAITIILMMKYETSFTYLLRSLFCCIYNLQDRHKITNLELQVVLYCKTDGNLLAFR